MTDTNRLIDPHMDVSLTVPVAAITRVDGEYRVEAMGVVETNHAPEVYGAILGANSRVPADRRTVCRYQRAEVISIGTGLYMYFFRTVSVELNGGACQRTDNRLRGATPGLNNRIVTWACVANRKILMSHVCLQFNGVESVSELGGEFLADQVSIENPMAPETVTGPGGAQVEIIKSGMVSRNSLFVMEWKTVDGSRPVKCIAARVFSSKVDAEYGYDPDQWTAGTGVVRNLTAPQNKGSLSGIKTATVGSTSNYLVVWSRHPQSDGSLGIWTRCIEDRRFQGVPLG